MSDPTSSDLRHTVLHAWHVNNSARMVPFGGWEMPVQYRDGIISEHLATRRGAGLFDVCHMGRFRLRGAGAARFASQVLTNNVRALRPGAAQYTFIANQTGGAVDDAYLYMLGEEDYLLVVNASNRPKDWDWIRAHGELAEVGLEDQSEALGMIALQGPNASAILEQIVPVQALPENKRNRVSVAQADGHEVVVSRTGYTGEPVCFELFTEAPQTVELWQRLVDLGATPIGLGARDSLRLEAGLPLYGHELGEDPEGREIPIFANGLAAFAVRAAGDEPFIGRDALERQREELVRIRRGEIDTPVEERILRRLIQPIAVFDGRRPLRAGYSVFLGERRVGVVTSGTTVPAARFYGQGIAAQPAGEHTMRPVGLALIDSDIRYRSDRPVALRIEDGRGNAMQAELVERNLWPSTPFARAYRGFRAPVRRESVDADEVRALAGHLAEDAARNTAWRRTECVNLIPSEQTVSPFVERLCTTDPSGRYNEHNRLRSLGPDAPYVRYYKGTEFIMDKETELKAALRTFFGCARAETRIVSGQMANDTVYDALKQFRNRHRRGQDPRGLGPVLVHDLNKGGHLSAQVAGALKNYIAIDPLTERPAVEHFPFMRDNPHRIDVEATKALIGERRPELIVFGRSVIIHREPVREVAEFVFDEFGRDDPQRPLILYDGAHVLGLLGDAFQRPLDEGADLVTGSTHKTFFGPQRGVILGNIEPGSAFEDLWRHIESRAFPGHVSNHHLGTLLGLLGATYEMIEHRDTYPRLVVENAKAFARALDDEGLALEGDGACDFTETHQVLLRGARGKGEYLASLLETNNVITNPQAYHDDASFAAASGVRMGTQEMTRYGMQAGDFRELATLIAEMARGGRRRDEGHWRDAVKRFRARFTDMRFTL
jgi:aminomethyltransferase